MTSNIYSNEYKEIIKRLRSARIEVGLTQAQVAKELGKPQSYISKSEAGERRLDITELNKFARLYKMNINIFIE